MTEFVVANIRLRTFIRYCIKVYLRGESLQVGVSQGSKIAKDNFIFCIGMPKAYKEVQRLIKNNR